MPFKSKLRDEKFGFAILPANKTFLDFFDLINFIISPNLPMLILYEFLFFLNLLFLEKSIIKYIFFIFFIFFKTI